MVLLLFINAKYFSKCHCFLSLFLIRLASKIGNGQIKLSFILKLLTVLNVSEEKFRPKFNFLGHSLKISFVQ